MEPERIAGFGSLVVHFEIGLLKLGAALRFDLH